MAPLVTRRLTDEYVMLDAADGKVLITVSGVGAEAVANSVTTAVNNHDRLLAALKAALGPLDAASTAWVLAYDALRAAEGRIHG